MKSLLFLKITLILVCVSQAFSAIPRAEHPRPDMYRSNWMNLNGQWQFEIDNDDTGFKRGLTTGVDLKDEITVPFCPESKLSGIGHYDFMTHVWYRRFFDLPSSMNGKTVLLHFGAVDYQCWVYVNGELAGTHRGGNVAFGFDITNLVKAENNEVVVRVFDDTASGDQPTGKQTHTVSEGCMYTRTTGIWQTVWLEAVNESYIQRFALESDIEKGRALIDVTVKTFADDLKLKAEAYFDGKLMATETTGSAAWRDNKIVLNLKDLHLWEVGNPNLYDLKLFLMDGNKVVDQVESYFGMRSVKIVGRGVYINGKPVFQRLILDQGFYPDGVWTAPSDEALKNDIVLSMKAGYNGARLHQKVFEPRFLYWADQLGYLCWGEYTNWGFDFRPESYSTFIDEWVEILHRDRNHPAIIGWCPFNETPGKAAELQRTIYYITQAVDPTRPTYETSGWSHRMNEAEVNDIHDYDQNPETFHKRWMKYFAGTKDALIMPSRYGAVSNDFGVPFMVSEFGGIGWSIKEGWGYGAAPKTLEEFYTRYEGLCKALLDNPDMYAFCYTQLTDVEQEQNGLYFYDRSEKFDMNRIFAATQQKSAFEQGAAQTGQPDKKVTQWKVLVGASVDPEKREFKYVTEKPSGAWMSSSYSDSSWKSGMAPFSPEGATKWNTSDIWLRQEFTCEDTDFNAAAIVINYDEDTQVYVNGKLVFEIKNWSNGFEIYDISEALSKAIKKGTNVIAIHTSQTTGGQTIDAGILVD